MHAAKRLQCSFNSSSRGEQQRTAGDPLQRARKAHGEDAPNIKRGTAVACRGHKQTCVITLCETRVPMVLFRFVCYLSLLFWIGDDVGWVMLVSHHVVMGMGVWWDSV